ncbi:MAG: hypothetical protein AB7P40_17035 [Chloroflexota bacterium]
MAETLASNERGDAEDMARVAALVARAGLKLPAHEIAGLVTAYRSDRAGFARLREILEADDETAHAFQAARPDGVQQ